MTIIQEETLVRAMFDRQQSDEMRRLKEARAILTAPSPYVDDTAQAVAIGFIDDYNDAKNKLMWAGMKGGL